MCRHFITFNGFMMTNLLKARESGSVDQFAVDHETDFPGNEAAL